MSRILPRLVLEPISFLEKTFLFRADPSFSHVAHAQIFFHAFSFCVETHPFFSARFLFPA